MSELMPGIEVLSQKTATCISPVSAFFIIFGLTLLFGGISLTVSKWDITYILLSLVGIVFAIVPARSSNECFKMIEYEEYKVIINKDVSLIEFNEKYEIIHIDEKIYTIKEIEKGD